MTSMSDGWHARTEGVVAAAAAAGLQITPRRFPSGTRTAADAAAAIRCPVEAICKSIVVTSDEGPAVVLTSGGNRVDMAKVGRLLGRVGVRRADADEARAATGQPIGGTAPFGHPQRLPVLVDADLLRHDEIWAAAGTPDTVFGVAPQRLAEAVGATVADVADATGP
jgi:prolyl-tRNA editing enzyme YbaK/EbsC (Cys-tRNA(Pro) deacylase)